MSVALDKLLGKARRDLFLPLTFRLSIKLEQVDWREVCQDPGLGAFVLRSTQRLFKADGLVNWFDTWLEAEAAGAAVERDALGAVRGKPKPPPRLPDAATFARSDAVQRVTDIASRLCQETRDEVSVLGYLTGGGTLLGRLLGGAEARKLLRALDTGKPGGAERASIEAVVQLVLVLARAYCEAGAGALLLAEEERIDSFAYLKGSEALFNLAGYYGVPVLLVSRHPLDEASRAEAHKAGVRYVSAPGAGVGGVCSIPDAVLGGDEAQAASWIKARRERAGPRLFVTEWEIPPGTAPQTVIALQKQLAG